MKTFLGVLSKGKGTWGQVAHIIDNSDYDNVYLISNEWAQDKFNCSKKVNWIIIDPRKGFSEIMDDIDKTSKKHYRTKLNLHSGSGKRTLCHISSIATRK